LKLDNRTEIPATLLTTGVAEDAMLGAVIARPSFDVKGRELVPSRDAAYTIAEALQEKSEAPPLNDSPYLLGGIDVFVTGTARDPRGEAVPALRVDLQVGEGFRRSIDVIGDRRWTRTRQGLVASDPEPFTAMPLSYDRAFGGSLRVDEGEYNFTHNPSGKGFYVTEEQAEGQPLPNLEDPDHRITGFQDHPDPICFAPYPTDGTLKMVNSVEIEGEGDDTKLRRLLPTCFNQAHPRLIIPAQEGPRVGDEIRVTNVRPEGDLRFALPDVELHAHVQLEGRSYVFPLHLDMIGIFCEEEKVFLSYRCVFRYRVVRLERRRTTLYAGPAPDAVPAGYVLDWSDEEEDW
jgi:hypothetical protein